MPTRRGRVFYIDRRLRTVGRLNQSLMTAHEDTAKRREQIILRLDERGWGETLSALKAGRITITQLEEAYDRGPRAVRRLLDFSGDPPLEEAIEEFRRARASEIKTVDRYYKSLRALKEWAPPGVRLSYIARPGVLNEFRRARLGRGVRGGTVLRDMAAVRQLLQWKGGKRLARSVFDEVSMPKPAGRRTRRFNPEEIRRLLIEAERTRERGGRNYADIYRLLLLTGLRPSELVSLRPVDVDLEAGLVRVVTSKTASGVREVPLVQAAAEILKRMMQCVAPGDRIIPASVGTISDTFRRHARRAAVPDAWLYDLRRTHAQYLRLATGDIVAVRDQLGHSTVVESEAYIGSAPVEERRPFVERAAELMGLAGEVKAEHAAD